ncbi:MAG: transcription antitermination factor NusB [Clostridia bacterium]|nr:transcription antitermination factor NusB [Clostridia bacterium]
MSRKMAREDAFKLIFEMNVTDISPEECIAYLTESVDSGNEMWAQKKISQSDMDYISEIVNKVRDNKEALNNLISSKLKKWTIDRISKVNLSLLQLAVAEIMYFDSIPDKVSTNEAIELAKIYGGEESKGFINGVLGAVLKEKEVIK